MRASDPVALDWVLSRVTGAASKHQTSRRRVPAYDPYVTPTDTDPILLPPDVPVAEPRDFLPWPPKLLRALHSSRYRPLVRIYPECGLVVLALDRVYHLWNYRVTPSHSAADPNASVYTRTTESPITSFCLAIPQAGAFSPLCRRVLVVGMFTGVAVLPLFFAPVCTPTATPADIFSPDALIPDTRALVTTKWLPAMVSLSCDPAGRVIGVGVDGCIYDISYTAPRSSFLSKILMRRPEELCVTKASVGNLWQPFWSLLPSLQQSRATWLRSITAKLWDTTTTDTVRDVCMDAVSGMVYVLRERRLAKGVEGEVRGSASRDGEQGSNLRGRGGGRGRDGDAAGSGHHEKPLSLGDGVDDDTHDVGPRGGKGAGGGEGGVCVSVLTVYTLVDDSAVDGGYGGVPSAATADGGSGGSALILEVVGEWVHSRGTVGSFGGAVVTATAAAVAAADVSSSSRRGGGAGGAQAGATRSARSAVEGHGVSGGVIGVDEGSPLPLIVSLHCLAVPAVGGAATGSDGTVAGGAVPLHALQDGGRPVRLVAVDVHGTTFGFTAGVFDGLQLLYVKPAVALRAPARESCAGVDVGGARDGVPACAPDGAGAGVGVGGGVRVTRVQSGWRSAHMVAGGDVSVMPVATVGLEGQRGGGVWVDCAVPHRSAGGGGVGGPTPVGVLHAYISSTALRCGAPASSTARTVDRVCGGDVLDGASSGEMSDDDEDDDADGCGVGGADEARVAGQGVARGADGGAGGDELSSIPSPSVRDEAHRPRGAASAASGPTPATPSASPTAHTQRRWECYATAMIPPSFYHETAGPPDGPLVRMLRSSQLPSSFAHPLAPATAFAVVTSDGVSVVEVARPADLLRRALVCAYIKARDTAAPANEIARRVRGKAATWHDHVALPRLPFHSAAAFRHVLGGGEGAGGRGEVGGAAALSRNIGAGGSSGALELSGFGSGSAGGGGRGAAGTDGPPTLCLDSLSRTTRILLGKGWAAGAAAAVASTVHDVLLDDASDISAAVRWLVDIRPVAASSVASRTEALVLMLLADNIALRLRLGGGVGCAGGEATMKVLTNGQRDRGVRRSFGDDVVGGPVRRGRDEDPLSDDYGVNEGEGVRASFQRARRGVDPSFVEAEVVPAYSSTALRSDVIGPSDDPLGDVAPSQGGSDAFLGWMGCAETMVPFGRGVGTQARLGGGGGLGAVAFDGSGSGASGAGGAGGAAGAAGAGVGDGEGTARGVMVGGSTACALPAARAADAREHADRVALTLGGGILSALLVDGPLGTPSLLAAEVTAPTAATSASPQYSSRGSAATSATAASGQGVCWTLVPSCHVSALVQYVGHLLAPWWQSPLLTKVSCGSVVVGRGVASAGAVAALGAGEVGGSAGLRAGGASGGSGYGGSARLDEKWKASDADAGHMLRFAITPPQTAALLQVLDAVRPLVRHFGAGKGGAFGVAAGGVGVGGVSGGGGGAHNFGAKSPVIGSDGRNLTVECGPSRAAPPATVATFAEMTVVAALATLVDAAHEALTFISFCHSMRVAEAITAHAAKLQRIPTVTLQQLVTGCFSDVDGAAAGLAAAGRSFGACALHSFVAAAAAAPAMSARSLSPAALESALAQCPNLIPRPQCEAVVDKLAGVDAKRLSERAEGAAKRRRTLMGTESRFPFGLSTGTWGGVLGRFASRQRAEETEPSRGREGAIGVGV